MQGKTWKFLGVNMEIGIEVNDETPKLKLDLNELGCAEVWRTELVRVRDKRQSQILVISSLQVLILECYFHIITQEENIQFNKSNYYFLKIKKKKIERLVPAVTC